MWKWSPRPLATPAIELLLRAARQRRAGRRPRSRGLVHVRLLVAGSGETSMIAAPVARTALGGHPEHPGAPSGSPRGHPRWCARVRPRIMWAWTHLRPDPTRRTPPTARPRPPPAARPAAPAGAVALDDRLLGGVAGGVADALGIDVVLVRLGFVVTAFFGGLGVIAYFLGWILLPAAPAATERRGARRPPPAARLRARRPRPARGRRPPGMVVPGRRRLLAARA